MITALQLLFEPTKTWDAIARRERSLAGVLLLTLLPTILIACVIEGWGLVRWGNSPTHLGLGNHHWVSVSLNGAVRYELGQLIMSVLTVFLLALSFHFSLRSFHCQASFTQSFTLMACSYGPLLLMQVVDGIPAVPTWVCRIIGAILAAKVFYLGLVRVVRPDPTTALGLYFLGSLLILGFAGISHFIVLQIIEGDLFTPWLGWIQLSG